MDTLAQGVLLLLDVLRDENGETQAGESAKTEATTGYYQSRLKVITGASQPMGLSWEWSF